MSEIDQKSSTKEWPDPVKSRGQLDSALEAGLASGRSPHKMEDIIEDEINNIKNG